MDTADTVDAHGAQRWRALLVPLTVNILLPLVLYYVLRAQGMVPWQALLLSSALPAAHALGTAVVRRRVDLFDLLVVVLLAASAVTSLVSGSPRVLLLKDAGIPAVLLPVDVVPVLGRFQSLVILGAVAVLTVRRSRAFSNGTGLPLFGLRPLSRA